MRSIFQLKRSAHRLVNLLFYGGCFVAGYICGKGLNFKFNLIQELLS